MSCTQGAGTQGRTHLPSAGWEEEAVPAWKGAREGCSRQRDPHRRGLGRRPLGSVGCCPGYKVGIGVCEAWDVSRPEDAVWALLALVLSFPRYPPHTSWRGLKPLAFQEPWGGVSVAPHGLGSAF